MVACLGKRDITIPLTWRSQHPGRGYGGGGEAEGTPNSGWIKEETDQECKSSLLAMFLARSLGRMWCCLFPQVKSLLHLSHSFEKRMNYFTHSRRRKQEVRDWRSERMNQPLQGRQIHPPKPMFQVMPPGPVVTQGPGLSPRRHFSSTENHPITCLQNSGD